MRCPIRSPRRGLPAPLPALLAALAVSVVLASAASAATVVQSITSWKQNARPVGWSRSLNRVIYNSRGADGLFDAYSANPDGSDPQCLTCTLPFFSGVGAGTNRGATDVSPDGRYMLVEVESGSHAGAIGAEWTQPGKGGANDIWLETTDGTQAWPLTDIGSPDQRAWGTNWARFDRTGNEIVYASMTTPAIGNLGYWQLKVANIAWTGGVAGLTGSRAITSASSTNFYEPYGFTPDDQHVIFASDYGMPSWMDSQIWTLGVDGTGMTRLSPDDAPDGFFTNYNEFAFYMPGDNSILYGSTVGSPNGGLDYWTMNADGTGSTRLTYFNFPWSTESAGYTAVGGVAFDPNDPNRFVAELAADPTSQTENAAMVTIDSSPAPGLSMSYFAGGSFAKPLSTTTGNPSDGFSTVGSPAPGVPASQYSIRWSGTLTAPTTGPYSLCTVADGGEQLSIDGRELVDSSSSSVQRSCGSTTLTAGVPVTIQLDDEYATGTSWGQLSWIPPGASAPTSIAASDMNAITPPTSGTTTSADGTSTAGGLKARRLKARRLKARRLKARRLKARRLKARRLKARRLKARRLKARRLKARRLKARRRKARRLRAERSRGLGKGAPSGRRP